jgi:hypothetical protein
MENIPKDVVLYLLDELDLESILKLCMTSKKYNTMICKNEFFWKLKINRERPGFLSLYEKVRDKYSTLNYTYKEIYQDLYDANEKGIFSIAWKTSPLEIFGVAEGDLQSLNFDPASNTEKITKKGDKIWAVVSNRPDFFFDGEPILVDSKKEAIDIIENHIVRIYDNENLVRLSYVREILEKNQFIKLGDYEFAFKEVPIV